MSECIVYDMTFYIGKTNHKTGWVPFQPAEFLAHRDPDGAAYAIRQYLDELRSGASHGNKIAIDTITGINEMFPNEEPITYD